MSSTAPSPAPGMPDPPRSSTASLVRSTLTVIGLVMAAGLAVVLVLKLERILTWLLIAAFFPIVLSPAVDFFERRLHFRRGLAAFTVFILGVALFSLMIYAFVRPIVDQAN